MTRLVPSKGYACVYRHPVPRPASMRLTQSFVAAHPLVRRYLDSYQRPGSVLDWGDDPSFFCAGEYGLPPSWGVCRPDVRAGVRRGDFVVFICARTDDGRQWDYYLTGCGTVAFTVLKDDRQNSEAFERYADFFNTLGRLGEGGWEQHEVIGRHSDWEKRIASPYVIFDTDPASTKFDTSSPVHVAQFRGDQSPLELWDDGALVQEIQRLLGLPTRGRGLRTTNPFTPHAKLRLDSQRLPYIRDGIISIMQSLAERRKHETINY